MKQEDFDSLAIFVAVVEELRHEPFFSEDNHDKLIAARAGVFCHPMFLKSAALPFRKIWMPSERCTFRKHDGTGGIRGLVYDEYSDKTDKKMLDGYRYWDYQHFDDKLTSPVSYSGTNDTQKDVINIWLNTQLAHTGPMNFSHKPQSKPKNPPKIKQFSIDEFKAWDARIGRERFEYMFRISVLTIGHSYISFAKRLAIPLFEKMRREGMTPSFEAEMALKYNPYPDAKYGIRFDDVFWHQTRETTEETFSRLLARQRFSGLGDFLRVLFDKADEAIDYVRKCETFDALLKDASVVILTGNPEWDAATFRGRFNANSYPELGRQSRTGGFVAFVGRKICFQDAAESVLRDSYLEFRAAFDEARERQRQPDKWKPGPW